MKDVAKITEDMLTDQDRDYLDAVIYGELPSVAFDTHIKIIKDGNGEDVAVEDLESDTLRLVRNDYINKFVNFVVRRKKEFAVTGCLKEIVRTKCTDQQLAFARHYIEYSGRKSRVQDAYLKAYPNAAKMTPFAIQTKAHEVFALPNVKLAIQKYREIQEAEFNFSLSEYIQELNENREKAKKLGQVSAMNQATLEKGKIFGYGEKKKVPDGSKENPIHVVQTIEDLINKIDSEK